MTLNDLVTKLNTIWGTFEDITGDTTDTRIVVFEKSYYVYVIIIDKNHNAIHIDGYSLSTHTYDMIYEYTRIAYISGG